MQLVYFVSLLFQQGPVRSSNHVIKSLVENMFTKCFFLVICDKPIGDCTHLKSN